MLYLIYTCTHTLHSLFVSFLFPTVHTFALTEQTVVHKLSTAAEVVLLLDDFFAMWFYSLQPDFNYLQPCFNSLQPQFNYLTIIGSVRL